MKEKITKQNVIELNSNTIQKIKNIAEHHLYSVDSDLYYEGQTPIVAYILLKGEVSLIKKRRKNIQIKPGSLFGFKELVLREESVYGAQIKENSEVVFLDRSLINDITRFDTDGDLKEVFEALLHKMAG